MSKAEEKAEKAYPKATRDIGGIVVDVGHPQYMRDLYIEGYHQAEKDLELTWKDIELIVNIDKDTDNEEAIIGVRNNEEHYEEVLKRFNESKR